MWELSNLKSAISDFLNGWSITRIHGVWRTTVQGSQSPALSEKREIAEIGTALKPGANIRVPAGAEERLAQMQKEKIEALEKENKTLQASLNRVTEERDQLQKEYDELKKVQSASSDSLQTEVSQLKTDKEEMKKELNLYKERLSASFTSQELASYLNEAIVDFNNKIGQSSEFVSYSIGNMDVGLKAQIVKQNDKLGFITSSEGETALSEIRFTIAATPRS